MTKAQLLKVLDRFPMNARVEFEIEGQPQAGHSSFATEPTRAFSCIGTHGLVLVLTDGVVPPLELEPEEVL